ncbi:MAG: UTP--glucose-1-phosphate uridylyltransferase, partial [Planctomycetota bacterium]
MSTLEDRTRTQEERFSAADQGHVLSGLRNLSEGERAPFLAELEAVDLELVGELGQLLQRSASDQTAPRFEPPATFPLQRGPEVQAHAAQAIALGEERLRSGKVGYVLVAGGQASRLGYDGPKGLFPIGPVTGRVLFDFHARRLLAAKARYGAPIRWYVMTSQANDAATKAGFEEHAYFGLERNEVEFFSQEMLPALSTEGKILMAAKDRLFLAPNGHGGCLDALARSGCLEDAQSRGIETLSYFQVDNPLARPADPLFLGLHAEERAQMSTKVVAKRDAAEKVGVIGRVNGELGCIEYSDLPEDLREARDEAGKLRFEAGNIAVHLIETDFAKSLTDGGLKLPWHVARKKMKVMGEGEQLVERDGAKFEAFVFDALGSAERSVTLEVDRKLEFSPVKN